MKQIIVTHINGKELTEPLTLGFDPEKIVSTRSVGNACEFVYIESLGDRVSPKTIQCANYKSQIDGYISGNLLDLSVYDAQGNTGALSIQEKYVELIRDTTIIISGSEQACREIKFRPGSWVEKTIYVSNSMSSLATGALTTTTVAVTTTTTVAITTTTTVA